MSGAVNMYNRVTPQYKQVVVADRLGNPGIKNNQGTTVEVYDYVEVTTNAAKQTILFFEEVSTKNFPFTNIKQNMLQVGESLAVEYKFFPYMIRNTVTGVVTAWGSAHAVFPGINVAQYSVLLDNNRILKPLTLARGNNLFNPHGKTAENHVFYPDTDLVMPVQIAFTAQLVIPPVTITVGENEKFYLGLHWTGSGAILNLKENV